MTVSIPCLLDKDHVWLPLPKDRRKCLRCKLIIHHPAPISPHPDTGAIRNGPQTGASSADSELSGEKP